MSPRSYGQRLVVTVRCPPELLTKVEVAVSQCPVNVSRNEWILDAIEQKLLRAISS